ncbi:CBS domain-containing protein [Pullulanibacillus pueri]|uniref:CBS domain-containing protein n=1 Tax=Pullulanibacillus pueri TaxID=1437324 RepID=A0A8J3ELH8_9BACL|nr:CBS domain-containing protein [Pullulanibacillus pueri]MBM7681493.1 CBS domain-containing protein [Pullulanibacillus pueri]GGH79100.1 hypothetical protein GCM10007096_13530 [Pullulanibacillus pueri]
MFVKSVMIPKHKTYFVEDQVFVKEALELLEQHEIDGMPVIKGDTYKGLVTKNTIFEAAFHSNKEKQVFMDTTTVGEIATAQENTVNENDGFEETVIKMKNVPIVAVVDDAKRFLGIVTRYEVLDQFQSVFGMNKKGLRIVFSSVETEGRILRLSEITRQFHQNIISLTTFDDSDKLVRRIVMKVVDNEDTQKYIQKLEKNGFKVLDIKRT